MELFVDVFVLLAPKSTAVEGCKIPVAVCSRKVDFLNSETNRYWHFVEAVLIADVDIPNLDFNAFKKTENGIEPYWSSELLWFLKTLFSSWVRIRYTRSWLGGISWGDRPRLIFLLVLLNQIVHFNNV